MPYNSNNPWGSALSGWGDYFQNQANESFRLPQVEYNYDPSQQARDYQSALIQSLQGQAMGSRDTQAQAQLGQGYRSALAQQSSLGSTARGMGSGAALRGIGQRQAAISSELPGQQQMLQLQEQQAAQALLQQLMEQQRQQDFADAEARAQTRLSQQQMMNTYRQGLVGAGIENQASQQGRLLDAALAERGFNLERERFDRDLMQGAVNAGGTLAGSAFRSFGSSKRPSETYRQVEGQNSIVPEWDK